MGSGRDAGKTGADPSEPTGTLNLDSGGAALGAYDYDRIVEQSFYGWLGDVRVVGRPLSVREFLIAK